MHKKLTIIIHGHKGSISIYHIVCSLPEAMPVSPLVRNTQILLFIVLRSIEIVISDLIPYPARRRSIPYLLPHLHSDSVSAGSVCRRRRRWKRFPSVLLSRGSPAIRSICYSPSPSPPCRSPLTIRTSVISVYQRDLFSGWVKAIGNTRLLFMSSRYLGHL